VRLVDEAHTDKSKSIPHVFDPKAGLIRRMSPLSHHELAQLPPPQRLTFVARWLRQVIELYARWQAADPEDSLSLRMALAMVEQAGASGVPSSTSTLKAVDEAMRAASQYRPAYYAARAMHQAASAAAETDKDEALQLLSASLRDIAKAILDSHHERLGDYRSAKVEARRLEQEIRDDFSEYAKQPLAAMPPADQDEPRMASGIAAAQTGAADSYANEVELFASSVELHMRDDDRGWGTHDDAAHDSEYPAVAHDPEEERYDDETTLQLSRARPHQPGNEDDRSDEDVPYNFPGQVAKPRQPPPPPKPIIHAPVYLGLADTDHGLRRASSPNHPEPLPPHRQHDPDADETAH